MISASAKAVVIDDDDGQRLRFVSRAMIERSTRVALNGSGNQLNPSVVGQRLFIG